MQYSINAKQITQTATRINIETGNIKDGNMAVGFALMDADGATIQQGIKQLPVSLVSKLGDSSDVDAINEVLAEFGVTATGVIQ